MRFSEIKVGYIYNVIFDPVRNCEFDGKHLALVLKKNNDKNTFIVMPLTSSSRGSGINKIQLDKISSLPTSLKNNNTYAVFNQIRTVNAGRFIKLKEDDSPIECSVGEDVFSKLVILGIKEIICGNSQEQKIEILKLAYESERINKAKDLAYIIINFKKIDVDNEEKISELNNEIKKALQGISYSLEKKYVDDGIKDIFDALMTV
jgi:uncharacterized protein YifN (PemK superfamily)